MTFTATDREQRATAHAADAAPLRSHVMGLINAAWTTQVLATAARLRLMDRLAAGPGRIEVLAAGCACPPPALRRLLNALVSLDLCRECDDSSFALTAAGALLCADAPMSLHAWALLGGQRLWANWAGLCDSVRSGESVRQRAQGQDGFSELERDPAAAAVFNQAMVDITRPVAAAVAQRVDFGGVFRVVDVGGGSGALLATILAIHRELRGVLLDLEHATDSAAALFAAAGVAQRCEVMAGSFFDVIPPGADMYLLKSVLHNWDDEHCGVILRNCRNAMAPAARVLIVERIAPERFSASALDQAIARSDLNMLVSCSGCERTLAQFHALLQTAGLRPLRHNELSNDYSVIESIAA